MIVVVALLALAVAGIAALLVDRRRLRRRPYFLALAIHDRVLQSVAGARMSFENDEIADGFECLDSAMKACKEIISDTVSDAGGITPGTLSRMRASVGA
jgi:signal transduction histidine kinase